MKYSSLAFLFVFSIFFAQAAQAQQTFPQWLAQLKIDAYNQGVRPTTLERVMPQITLDTEVIELDARQPEKKKTFADYLRGTLPPSRIAQGKELLTEHDQLLKQIEKLYGIPAELIVALWGIESSFGDNMGEFSVLDSLATLAYEGRREEFFRNQLIEALHILDEEAIAPESFTGSWAGAMGQCQFMPSTYRAYAVDYDRDGKRDIWWSESDVFASIANYIKAEGWNGAHRWGVEVARSTSIPSQMMGLEKGYPVSYFHKHGITTLSGESLGHPDQIAYLIEPDGSQGPRFLVFENFKALMKWNRSTYFAVTVGLFADAIKSSS
jgi:membrane-bound lytic murein transglycosylase B